jgi:cell division septation protein DedD
MSWTDLRAILSVCSTEPAFIGFVALCAVGVFVAGLMAGATARRRDDDIDAWCDAGDTQAPQLPQRRAHVPPYPAQPPVAVQSLHDAQRIRVRAGAPALKPSYDSRK